MSELPAQAASGPGRKRKRLSHACNHCRARKIRCDEARPKCTNCDKTGTQCITQDPRNPGVFVERREAQRASQQPSPAYDVTPSSSANEPHTDLEEMQRQAPESHNLPEEPSPTLERHISPNSELLPALPRHACGYENSLSMLSQWLELAFVRLGIPRPFGSESPTVPRARWEVRRDTCAADLLRNMSMSEIIVQTQSFMGSLNTVFPIFTQASMERLITHWEEIGRSSSTGHSQDLASVLVALIIASNVQTSQLSISEMYLNMALYNLQTILANRSIHSIQALFLIALIHRCRDEIVLASNMISLAASNAQALGLHRRFSRRQSLDLGDERAQEYVLIWSSVYVLEKVITLELGRISTIRDFECNQVFPTGSSLFPSEALYELFWALFGLAKIQSEVIERFALSRHMEETTNDIESAVRSKMEMVGELDQKLLTWTRSLPPYAQALSNTTSDPEIRLAMPFLALQYWQTLFILHRNALLLNSRLVASSADRYFLDKPFRLRIKSGQSICCNAARMIVSILSDMYEHDAISVLRSSYAPLTAVYALGIHILRNPQLSLARADLEIQASAAGMVANHQHQIGTYNDPESEALRRLLENLHTELAARLNLTSTPRTSTQVQLNQQRVSAHSSRSTTTPNTGDLSSEPQAMPVGGPAHASTTAFPPPFSDLLLSDMSSTRLDMDFYRDTLDIMNLDWEALTLAYDLPS